MQKRRDFLLLLAYLAAVAAVFYLAGRYILVWTLPFLLALAVSSAVEPIIVQCREKLHFKRSFSAAVLTLLLIVGLVGGLFWLMQRLWTELEGALASLPRALAMLPTLADDFFARLADFSDTCPAELRHWIDTAIDYLATSLTGWAAELSAKAVAWVADTVKFLPDASLFCITTALAAFFTMASYPQVKDFFRRQMDARRWETVMTVRDSVAVTLWRWLKAQGILISVTFVQLLAGFFFLRQPYALLLSIGIALIDALPVFGTGTVLVPWSILCFLAGNMPKGIALLALYGILTVVRSILEPKVLASQADLSPLPSLLSMYVGFRVGGVAGMILCPLLLLLVVQLREAGVLRLWR